MQTLLRTSMVVSAFAIGAVVIGQNAWPVDRERDSAAVATAKLDLRE